MHTISIFSPSSDFEQLIEFASGNNGNFGSHQFRSEIINQLFLKIKIKYNIWFDCIYKWKLEKAFDNLAEKKTNKTKKEIATAFDLKYSRENLLDSFKYLPGNYYQFNFSSIPVDAGGEPYYKERGY